ncbi:hypothetical protein Tco_0992023 [Tanacetum coccineum]|uniref:Uncharacterized protein n=1 Tax=Tanacetum coccineum TaxID=301880 RepID=A0ABQ5F1B5_9ASTR
MIKELTSLQDDWCIKENKIVATVNESICSKFEKYLEEGKCFYISTFFVGDCPKELQTSFKSFDTLLQVEEQSSMSYDLIGDLISRGTIAHAMVDGNRRPYIRLELEDLTTRSINVGKPAVSSMFGVSKLFINDDIPDIRNFKQKLIENRSHEGDDHCVTHLTTFSSYFIKNDFLNNLPKVCINDIRDIGKVLCCVKCNHKANLDTIAEKDEYGMIVKKRIVFMCTNKACGQDTHVEYKRETWTFSTDFNKLLENTYAFKVDIKDFNIEKDKHTYGISQLTNDTDIINELIKRESDDQDVLSVTGDNMALRDDEKSTTSSPGKSKLLNVIDVDNDPSLYSIKKSCCL